MPTAMCTGVCTRRYLIFSSDHGYHVRFSSSPNRLDQQSSSNATENSPALLLKADRVSYLPCPMIRFALVHWYAAG